MIIKGELNGEVKIKGIIKGVTVTVEGMEYMVEVPGEKNLLVVKPEDIIIKETKEPKEVKEVPEKKPRGKKYIEVPEEGIYCKATVDSTMQKLTRMKERGEI